MARSLIPWATGALVAPMLLLAVLAEPAALEYDAARVAAEPWRLLTSQLVHWSTGMLVGDLLLVGIAGAIVERRSRRLAGVAILLGAAASAAAMGLSPQVVRYRGSSGIGMALLVAGGVELARRGTSRGSRLAGAAALAACALKLALEATGAAGATLLPDGVVPATAVHVAAAAAGVAAWIVSSREPLRVASAR